MECLTAPIKFKATNGSKQDHRFIFYTAQIAILYIISKIAETLHEDLTYYKWFITTKRTIGIK